MAALHQTLLSSGWVRVPDVKQKAIRGTDIPAVYRQVFQSTKKLVITGPNKIAPTLLEDLAEWMDNSGCYLGLGDGTGMNFSAKLRGVAKYLVESLSEAESNGSDNGRATVSQETTS